MEARQTLIVASALALVVASAAAGPTARSYVYKPLIGKPVAVPAQPLAGKRFSVSFKVTRSDTGKPLVRGKMAGDPYIAGALVRHAESFSGGTARVSFVVPTKAAGKLLKVKVTIRTAGGSSTSRVASFRIRGSVQPPPPRPVTVSVTGSPQVVYDWTTERCGLWDIPDLSARAFRDASGQVQLIAAMFNTRRSIGPDLDHVRRDCTVVLPSHFNADPAAYDDHEWIASTWTPDGKTVYALIHHEYDGDTHPGTCASGDNAKCWWNTITTAVSTDEGHSYVHTTPPALVATYPYRYVPDSGTFGPMSPSNIVRNDADGYFYALVYVKEQPVVSPPSEWKNHICLIRTKDLAEPSSWRAWSGGTSFSTTFIDPYSSTADPAEHLCRGVSPDELRDFPLGSLTFVAGANQWLLVGVGWEGFYYSTSTDLINWTPRDLLLHGVVPWRYRCGGPDPVHYPSVLDPASTSRNFETIGKTAYLYYTQFHTTDCQQGPDRDLVRVPITISR